MASTSCQKVAPDRPRKLEPKDLPVLRRLARGLSSFVYETTWQGKRHCRKDFPIGSIVGKFVFENETKHLFDLDHPNIVKCFGYTIGKSACLLLQEYVDDNLQSIIQKRIELQRKEDSSSSLSSRVLSIEEIKGLLSSPSEEKEIVVAELQGSLGLGSTIPFDLSEAFDIISQIAIGMKYLHDNAIIHGDLKPKNVLVHQGLYGRFEVRINDFGLVGTKKHSRLDSKRRQHLDVLMWKAPELLDELLGPSTKYSINPFIDSDSDEDVIEDEFKESGSSSDFEKGKLPMADVYSFGLLCSYIMGGELMHPNLRLTQFQNDNLDDFRPKLPPTCPEPLNSLICRCLEFESLKRPTFSTLVDLFTTPALKAYLSDSPNSLEVASVDMSKDDEVKPYDVFTLKTRSAKKRTLSDCEGTLVDLNKTGEVDLNDGVTLRTHGDEKRMLKDFGKYGVFISHRGPDTKTGFVSYLYEALGSAGLHPFLDCISIGKGQDAWKCIDHAIQTTPLALVIFSKSFAQSEWCLKELHAMLDSPSVKVLPIFYKVQPWEVSFPEKGQLAIGFTKLAERHDKTLIEEWRADLKRVSKLHGWEHKEGDKRLEKDLVLEVVGKIFELANKPLPFVVGDHIVGDHIVGVKQVAQNLIQTVDEKKVLLLGLWGMGGIGKSTLARELYNQLGRRFDVRCYVEDVAEKVIEGGVTSVQNHIMKALCENDLLQNIVDESRGLVILEERLSRKPILVVLDDVRGHDEMCYLMSRKMLKEGSMCIVTSRDRRVFEKSTSFHVNHEVYTHDVQLLNKEDSRTVFACHAFGGDRKVPPRFGGLVGNISMACGGVPLVLKVYGSLLRDEEDVEIWEEALKKLICGGIMDERKIFECLRFSYDSLSEHHQEMFLDIACALLGASVEMAKLVWRSQGWFATLGVRSLVEKALIRIDEFGAFSMHDHLRDLGRAISKQERANVGICKRLCGSESLALLDKNGPLPNSLQTLVLPQSLTTRVDLSLMKGLRILKCKGGLFWMSSLPKNLRWLDFIKNFHVPLRPFPEALENNELVILIWRDDLMDKLPKSFGNLRKLEVLNLRNSRKLLELPNSFGGLQNLSQLDLQGSGIQGLPKSFGELSSLEVLNLRNSRKLVELPDSFGGLQNLKNLDLGKSGIQSLPKSFGKLRHLEVLSLQFCHKLAKLPDSFGGLQNLNQLDLERGGIQGLPKSFGELSNLEVLNLRNSRKLVELPDSFGGLQNLKNLDLGKSGIRSLPQSFGQLTHLEVLNLQFCHKLAELPVSFSGLQNLKNLDLEESGIQGLPKSFGELSNLEVLNLQSCAELVELPHSFGDLQNLKNLDLGESGIQSLPKSFGELSLLEVLNLRNCGELVELPNSFGGLQNLNQLDLKGSGIQS